MKNIWANCIHAGENKPCSLLGIKGTDSLINEKYEKAPYIAKLCGTSDLNLYSTHLHLRTHLHISYLALIPSYVGTTFR